MAGIKGKSGRKKIPSKALKEAWDNATSELPELVKTYVDLAKDGKHIDLFEYICDRIMGRPKQETDLRVKGVITFTAEDYELLTRPKADETRLIAEYSQVEGENAVKQD